MQKKLTNICLTVIIILTTLFAFAACRDGDDLVMPVFEDLDLVHIELDEDAELWYEVWQTSSGEKTISPVYKIIRTLQDFMAINNEPDGNYILANDIDLSGYSAGSNFLNSFAGVLNGNNYTITVFSPTHTYYFNLIETVEKSAIIKTLF